MGRNHVWVSTGVYTWASAENIDTASYADDNTPYTTGNPMEEVIQKLKTLQKLLIIKQKLTLTSVPFYNAQTVKLVWLLKTKKLKTVGIAWY